MRCTGTIKTFSKNVVVEWITLLFRIREVPCSNLGPETGYPERFRGFPQPYRLG
jgi:hypothetical protein